jgi:hypothetical protein
MTLRDELWLTLPSSLRGSWLAPGVRWDNELRSDITDPGVIGDRGVIGVPAADRGVIGVPATDLGVIGVPATGDWGTDPSILLIPPKFKT